MGNVIGNTYEFIRAAVGRESDIQKAIETEVYSADLDQHKSANRAFGRLALRFYNNGEPYTDYEHILGELKYDMVGRRLKLIDLGLDEEEVDKLRAISGLE